MLIIIIPTHHLSEVTSIPSFHPSSFPTFHNTCHTLPTLINHTCRLHIDILDTTTHTTHHPKKYATFLKLTLSPIQSMPYMIHTQKLSAAIYVISITRPRCQVPINLLSPRNEIILLQGDRRLMPATRHDGDPPPCFLNLSYQPLVGRTFRSEAHIKCKFCGIYYFIFI